MSTREVADQMVELEKQWFAEHAAAKAARGRLLCAAQDDQIEAAGAELRRAEERKTAIMARIEALEASLLE